MAVESYRIARFAVLIFLAAVMAASGQERAPGQYALASVKELRCSFSASVAGNWQNGDPQVRVSTGQSLPAFVISDIDAADGSATMRGKDGPSALSVQLSGSNLYFLLDSGASGATLLTVFSQMSQPGRLKAVYTQTQPDLAQAYGDCEVLE